MSYVTFLFPKPLIDHHFLLVPFSFLYLLIHIAILILLFLHQMFKFMLLYTHLLIVFDIFPCIIIQLTLSIRHYSLSKNQQIPFFIYNSSIILLSFLVFSSCLFLSASKNSSYLSSVH